jgi:hypothetical protein
VLASWSAGALVLGEVPGLRRGGRVYPADEVAQALADLPFVAGAAVVTAPGGDRPRLLLLVFLAEEAPTAPSAAREELLRARLRLRLGDEHLPDAVSFLTLCPRRRGAAGPLDEDWVRLRHGSGALPYMESRPVFRALTALRRRCLRRSGASAPSPAAEGVA